MIASRFAVSVPLASADEVFVYHTLTGAHVVVSGDVHRVLVEGRTSDVRPTAADDAALAEARDTLADLGFLVSSPADDDRALADYFAEVKESSDQLRVTVLTTLRCNAACDYCVQGTHDGDQPHMTLETAERVARWLEAAMDDARPTSLVVTFFGGEPLLNVPALEHVARRARDAGRLRGIDVSHVIVTNGVLLSRALLQRLLPLGVRAVKVTLDGDRETHDRRRPLRGGHGTFDRILRNLRDISGLCRISIGGNVDAEAADACARLLDTLAAEPFAGSLGHVSFKPVISPAPQRPANPRIIRLLPADAPSAASCGSSPCDGCGFADEAWTWLREQTSQRGLPVPDGVHMGPCEIHRRHSHTIGPDGTLFACPGYAGSEPHAVGHVARAATPAEAAMGAARARLAAWQACGDCSFVPVCAGGCSVAAHHEQGDMSAPSCHKPALSAAVAALARTCTKEAQ